MRKILVFITAIFVSVSILQGCGISPDGELFSQSMHTVIRMNPSFKKYLLAIVNSESPKKIHDINVMKTFDINNHERISLYTYKVGEKSYQSEGLFLLSHSQWLERVKAKSIIIRDSGPFTQMELYSTEGGVPFFAVGGLIYLKHMKSIEIYFINHDVVSIPVYGNRAYLYVDINGVQGINKIIGVKSNNTEVTIH